MATQNQEPSQKQMYIVTAPCWKCKGHFNVALMRGDDNINNGQVYGLEFFSKEEIELAQSHEVIIKEHFSGTRQESYAASTCPHCDTFVGQHFLFSRYFCPAQYGDYTHKILDIVTP